MIAESAARWLETQGEGVVGTDLLVGFQPDKPDDLVVLYDESAPVDEDAHSLAVDRTGLQVFVRNADYAVAREKAFALHKRLLSFGGQEFYAGFPVIDVVQLVSAPQPIGPDERGRAEWSAHYSVRFESTGDQWRR